MEISLFTLDDNEQNRHSAAELLSYINKQIINFENQELYKTKIPSISTSSYFNEAEVLESPSFKKKEINLYPINENSFSEDMKMKKSYT